MSSSPVRSLHRVFSCVATWLATPDRRFLWMLASQPCLPPDGFARLRQQACQLGFDVDRLAKKCR